MRKVRGGWKEEGKVSKADLFGAAVKSRGSERNNNRRAPYPMDKREVRDCVNPSSDSDVPRADQMYQDLHHRVSSRAFNSRSANHLSQIADIVRTSCFLDLDF